MAIVDAMADTPEQINSPALEAIPDWPDDLADCLRRTDAIYRRLLDAVETAIDQGKINVVSPRKNQIELIRWLVARADYVRKLKGVKAPPLSRHKIDPLRSILAEAEKAEENPKQARK